jgi:uncharacterized protein YdaT
MITINLNKAKDITKNRLREERKPLLEKLDVDYMKAIEMQADATEIVAEKQRLRDITKLVDSARTVDQLKNMTAN